MEVLTSSQDWDGYLKFQSWSTKREAGLPESFDF